MTLIVYYILIDFIFILLLRHIEVTNSRYDIGVNKRERKILDDSLKKQTFLKHPSKKAPRRGVFFVPVSGAASEWFTGAAGYCPVSSAEKGPPQKRQPFC